MTENTGGGAAALKGRLAGIALMNVYPGPDDAAGFGQGEEEGIGIRPEAATVEVLPPFRDDFPQLAFAEIIGINPGVESDRAGELEARRVAHRDVLIGSVQAECLPDLARSERCAIYESAVVVTLNVIGIAISGPPAHHVCGRRRAAGRLLRTRPGRESDDGDGKS